MFFIFCMMTIFYGDVYSHTHFLIKKSTPVHPHPKGINHTYPYSPLKTQASCVKFI